MLRQKFSNKRDIGTSKKPSNKKNSIKVFSLTKTSKNWVSCTKCWYMMTSVKKCNVAFRKISCFLKNFSYLISTPSFKSINSRSLSRKKSIELTVPSDAMNCKPFFKHCTLQTMLQVLLLFIFISKKIICCILSFFVLVWGGIQCYSIKWSVFLVLFE